MDRPTAAISSSGPTRSGNIDWNAGQPSALAHPVPKEMAASTSGAPWSVATTAVITAASSNDTIVVTTISLRRLTRSASTPPNGLSNAVGRNPRAATTPFHAACPVRCCT